MKLAPFDLDVRPILRSGGEPFSAIMLAVDSLEPGQALRLLASFKPVPLFQVLGARGFEAAAREIGDGDWEVMFTPVDQQNEPAAGPNADSSSTEDSWPVPALEIDCRDLPPPEPMVKVLETVETLDPGTTMSALLPREPRFLFPELEARGHSWRGEQRVDGEYHILIRRSARESGNDT